MASLLTPEASPFPRAIPAARSARQPPATAWLFGPWADALLIANVAWPVLLIWQAGEGFAGRDGVQFWQVYFLTTPHRWITLTLVFFDRRRMRERGGLFAAVAAAIVLLCLGVRLTTGTLMCLLSIDYVWNAWHFASQHHGVYRIYSRRAGASGSGDPIEKWALRGMLLYVILRVAGATWPYPRVEAALAAVDWVVVAAAAAFGVREMTLPRRSPARGLYLLSMLTLYVGLLLAVHYRRPGLVLSLATASAVFHATEYLALVTWSVREQEGALPGARGLLSYLAARWAVVLTIFIVLLGTGGWMLQQNFLQPWLTLNVIVAFLHYAYDGLLWRRGALPTAAAGPAMISAR